MANKQKFAQDVTFEEKTDTRNEWIAKLWATRRVGYLLDQIRLHGENGELKDEIVTLARRWGVVTPYTAMLIIEDERRRNVPVAQRSMREMEVDNRAASNSAAGIDSLRNSSVTGSQAVADSINTSSYRKAPNLQSAGEVAQQEIQPCSMRISPIKAAAALAKGPRMRPQCVEIPAGSSVGGGFGGGGAGFGSPVGVVEGEVRARRPWRGKRTAHGWSGGR